MHRRCMCWPKDPKMPGAYAWDEAPSSATLGAKREGTRGATVKRGRAQGGCLGARSRRKTRQAAKSCGEEQMSGDPQVSEWGDPAGETPATPCRTHRHGGGNPAN